MKICFLFASFGDLMEKELNAKDNVRSFQQLVVLTKLLFILEKQVIF